MYNLLNETREMLSTWVSLNTASTWKGNPNGDKVCIIFTLACPAKCTFPVYILFSPLLSLSLPSFPFFFLSLPALYNSTFLSLTNIYLLYRKWIKLRHFIDMCNIFGSYTPSSHSQTFPHLLISTFVFISFCFEGIIDVYIIVYKEMSEELFTGKWQGIY